MKKMMILVSAIMMVAAGYAKNVEIKPFEGVDVNVPACVRFISGDNYEVGVRSTDSMEKIAGLVVVALHDVAVIIFIFALASTVDADVA